MQLSIKARQKRQQPQPALLWLLQAARVSSKQAEMLFTSHPRTTSGLSSIYLNNKMPIKIATSASSDYSTGLLRYPGGCKAMSPLLLLSCVSLAMGRSSGWSILYAGTACLVLPAPARPCHPCLQLATDLLAKLQEQVWAAGQLLANCSS